MSLAVPSPSSACGSFSSSPMNSESSLFSRESWSTGASSISPELEPLAFHHSTPPPGNDAAKAASIRLPLHLPTPPDAFDEVDVSSLVVDDELEGAPVGFAVGKLRSIGSNLLNATTSTCLHVPAGPVLPQYLRVNLPSLPNASVDSASSVLLPSHVFAIRSSDSPRTLLLPAHGLLWAATSPSLDILSSRPEKQPAHPSLPSSSRPVSTPGSAEESSTYLPVVELNLPSSSTFPCLQGWVYLRSPALLLSSLLPTPTSTSSSTPSSLSHLLNPEPKSTASPLLTPENLTETLSSVSSQTLLAAVHRVHGLWGNVVALQIADEDLWKVMGMAWKILVAALALRERERTSRTVSSP